MILLAFCVAIRSVPGMQIAPASDMIPREIHLAALAAVEARLATMTAAFEKLQFQFETLLRNRFGVRSESIDQLHLFGSEDVELISCTCSARRTSSSSSGPRKFRSRRW